MQRSAWLAFSLWIELTVAAHAQVKILQVTNAADYTNTSGIRFEIPTGGGIAAVICTGLSGTLATIPATRYPLPVEVAGVSVDVFGVSAPILGIVFASDHQEINIQVPWESVVRQIAGVYTDFIEVRQNGQYDRIKVESTLGIGRLFSDANGYAIAQHASDYSPVTSNSPARPGELLIVYATGLGPVDMPQQTGYPAPLNPPAKARGQVDVVVAGTPGQVLFEGLAPGLVGVNQIDFQVPPSAQAVDLELKLSITLVGCFSSTNAVGICEHGQTPQTVTETSRSVKIPVTQ